MLKLRQDVEIIPLATEHASQMLEWMQDTSVSRNIGLRSEPDLEKTLKWIKNTENSQEIYAFAIVSEGHHRGNVILDKVDDYILTARFSIYIGNTLSRGSGIGRTATYRICKFGFEHLSLNKIWLTVHARNLPALNTYTQIGFNLEGILRKEFLLEGNYINAFYMGLLKEEFAELEASFD